MKKLVLFIALFLPFLSAAQKQAILTVYQAPEFGFSLQKNDTTIVKGNSAILGSGLILYGGSGSYSFRWSPSKTLNDSTILHPVARPTDTTTYLLTVRDKSGCSISVPFKVNVRPYAVTAELINGHIDFDALLFPNPNKGEFKIQFKGIPLKKIDLKVIDNTGKVLYRQTIRNFSGEQTEILRLYLVNGFYTLHITAGKFILNRSFIIN